MRYVESRSLPIGTGTSDQVIGGEADRPDVCVDASEIWIVGYALVCPSEDTEDG